MHEVFAVGGDSEISADTLYTNYRLYGARKIQRGRCRLLDIESTELTFSVLIYGIGAGPSFEEVLFVARLAVKEIRTIRRNGVADVGGYRNPLVEAREWCASAVGRLRLHDAERRAAEQQGGCQGDAQRFDGWFDWSQHDNYEIG